MKMEKIGKPLALMVLGMFIFSAIVYADATIVDNLNMNGTADNSFGIYNDGNLVLNQNEQVNGTINRTRTISIDTSDQELRNYVDSKNSEWSATGSNPSTIANLIGQSVNYLEGKDYTSDVAPQIGDALDSYFASDKDIQVLLKAIDDLQMKTANLNIRVAAIERTLETTSADDYCAAKLETAKKYNITINGLKCGLNSTYYYAVNPAEHNGNSMIAIETYNPNIDTKPIKMGMIVPSAIFKGSDFNIGIVVNNTGSKFGAYKIVVTLPEGWVADQTMFSGTIADQEVKTIYVKVTPGNTAGNVTAGAKILLSGTTYMIVSQAKMNPIALEENHPAPVVQEEPKTIFIAGTILDGIGKLLENSSEILGNISGNISSIIDNASGNSSGAAR